MNEHIDKIRHEEFDNGAMKIIGNLLNGENIHYTRILKNGKVRRYDIELFTENKKWYEHNEDNDICAACHKYKFK